MRTPIDDSARALRSHAFGRFPVSVSLSLLLALAYPAAGTEEPVVKMAGVRVAGPGYGENGNEIQPFRESPGLTLVLVVEAPQGKSLVEIDTDESNLESIADDRGNDLREGVRWGYFPEMTRDGRYALIEISVSERPAVDAARVTVEGSVALQLAGKTTTQRLDSASFQSGSVLELDGGRLKVEVAGKDPEWNDALRIVLGTTTEFHDTIRELRFLGTGGSPLETQGTGTTTIGSQVQVETYFTGDTLPVGLEVERFEGLDQVVVPFRLQAGLGLDG